MGEDVRIQTKHEYFSVTPESSVIEGSASDFNAIDQLPRVWVNGAKEGQIVSIGDELFTVTREGLESSLGTWKDGFIGDDHKEVKKGFKIYEDRFVSPFLAFLLDEKTAERAKTEGGGSIDAIATKIKDNKITKMTGVGYSILSKGVTPSCTHESGCGIPIMGAAKVAKIDTKWDFNKADYSLEQLEASCAWVNTAKEKEDRTKEDYKLAFKLPNGTIVWGGVHAAMSALNGARQDVNIPSKDRKSVYKILVAAYKLFDKEPPELKPAIRADQHKKQGGKKNMADGEKTEVMFSKAQVAEITAAAVLEVTEKLGNESKVAVSDLEKAHSAELGKLGETHVTELETERAAIMKQAAMVESVATKYGLSEEAKKSLTDAKTLEDALALFSGLNVAAAEPVVAAEGGGQTGGGIVMGAAVKAKAPKVQKVEEFGNYNPYTRKYEATYREEVTE